MSSSVNPSRSDDVMRRRGWSRAYGFCGRDIPASIVNVMGEPDVNRRLSFGLYWGRDDKDGCKADHERCGCVNRSHILPPWLLRVRVEKLYVSLRRFGRFPKSRVASRWPMCKIAHLYYRCNISYTCCQQLEPNLDEVIRVRR
jgi:hypothetical protein